MKNFRGQIIDLSLPASSEPYFDGSDFSTKEKEVPTSVNYKVDDLLAVGKLSPISTEILHDSSAVDALVNSDVQPSNVNNNEN